MYNTSFCSSFKSEFLFQFNVAMSIYDGRKNLNCFRSICDPGIDTQACSKVGGRGGSRPPQILADQLTLSRPGGTHYPHPVLPAPPGFLTLAACLTLRLKF